MLNRLFKRSSQSLTSADADNRSTALQSSGKGTHQTKHIAPDSSALVDLQSVGYAINSNRFTADAIKKQLVDNINLKVLPNEKISVIGPNGAGKSTLMKLILGLIKPTSGRIHYQSDLRIGYVPQKFNVPTILPLRVRDLLNQVPHQLNADEQQQLFERLSVQPLLEQQVAHLSGGETQRILLARALLSKPDLLILDEPMQGLDPESERWLYEFIDNLPPFLQCAMVVVSHDLHWVMRGSRHVVCINKHICCEGQPSDLGVSDEFKRLFGHQYEAPYIHHHHGCQHGYDSASLNTLSSIGTLPSKHNY